MPEPEQTRADPAIVVIPPAAETAAPSVAFSAYGVPVLVTSNLPHLLDHVRTILPPGSRERLPSETQTRFSLLADNSGTYAIAKSGKGIARGIDLDLALEVLDSQLRIYIGEKSPEAIFVHAGVVAHRGRGLVLPGVSFAGKTTLVAELVAAGATYYSDEFALIDERGLVYPYAKPLSIRDDSFTQTHHRVETLGGTAGVEPVPVGAIVVTRFRAGAEWNPRRLSTGEGVLAMFANTVPAQSRPAEAMRALARAAAGAIVIESDRAEASDVAPMLLAELERAR